MKLDDALSPDAWAELWERSSSESVLRETQIARPERWRRFYDEVAAEWEMMTGVGDAVPVIVDALVARAGVIQPGTTVLEPACGAGALALATANAGARVIALDESPGMIAVLKRRLASLPASAGTVEVRTGSWTDPGTPGTGEVSVAAFFPPAWEPTGLRRMEELASRACVLVVPEGGDIFPFRRRLWSAIMPASPPGRAVLLPYLFNYLHATGRVPNVISLSWQARLDVPLEAAVSFYVAYFSIFGVDEPEAKTTIRKTLCEYTKGDRLSRSGTGRATLIWWTPPQLT